MFKSEIRDSSINALLEKAANRNYEKYLPKIVLKKVRGFVDEPVSFDFPVTALIGPNGGGKTTILGSAACAYIDVPPKRFFAKSGKYDESMQDWSIEYEIIDRTQSPKDSFRRTASFKNRRWKRDAVRRPLIIFGVSRTVPANERSELLRCSSGSFEVQKKDVVSYDVNVIKFASRILGKDLSGFGQLNIRGDGKVSLLTGRTKENTGYSEFHFGAGESSVIRMVYAIESSEDQALVLIEEIENGLHPVATVRLVEYLVGASERKRIQVIFTTHSNEALQPLPSKAVWVATQDKIFQGKLDVSSLRAITGKIEKELAIFVEDSFAKLWVEAIMRQCNEEYLQNIEVHSMEGDGTAVAMNKYHNQDPSMKHPSIAVIDGDSRQKDSDRDYVYRLPGESPESYVFDSVLEAWPTIGGKISVALLKRFEESDAVQKICHDVRRTNMDPHLLYAQVGENLGLVPELTVSTAFANIWAQVYTNESSVIIKKVKSLLADAEAKRVAS